ncbi:DUF3126 family protein [Pseudovibrio sp. Tun.PSC04-5.I4]|uniref:DUF3126 family protein n=1 Tax=Pseudovibrio sp. Tun.PSC04-5.I4 TaxID=1798213 RepID=UPI00088FE16A|nr:DUF3126 family protein [Pseudovibrio sp. Tun.PSC04-5.I4]SDR38040.1 Protein of unknown function [Pseudovibrio sp. Tun.PSC04-5.I4]
MKPDEIRKVQAFMRNAFKSPDLEVRARSNKDDSAEVFINNEFLGIVFRDEEDGELSWGFQMAILEIDVEGL